MEIRDILLCMNVCTVSSMVRSRMSLYELSLQHEEQHISHGRLGVSPE